YRITRALDAAELYGPDVDIACGAQEPAVDEWEAGTRYPSFGQGRAYRLTSRSQPEAKKGCGGQGRAYRLTSRSQPEAKKG
ncbi:hypothetical protein P3G66_31950, partial [Rhodococcus sp. C3V]|nr:hypothetical protein [Rhodococcus sp. C3V]